VETEKPFLAVGVNGKRKNLQAATSIVKPTPGNCIYQNNNFLIKTQESGPRMTFEDLKVTVF